MKKIFFALSVFLLFAACERPENKNAKITIAVPEKLSFSEKVFSNSVQAYAAPTDPIDHIVLNVTGSGMAPFVFNWDAKSGTAPTQLELDFPQGTGRLIQMIVVYQNQNSRDMSFYYGDATADFNASSVTVKVPIAKLNTGSVVSGQISGRYITAINASVPQGPTGLVEIGYAPPNNKPAMIIERNMIFNGWFSFFGLSDVDLTYKMGNGKILFGGPTKLNDKTKFPDVSARILKSAAPVHKELKDGSEQIREGKLTYWGWFGDTAAIDSTLESSYKICRSFDPISKFKNYNTPTSLLTLSELVNSGLFPSATSDLTNISASNATLGYLQYTGGILSSNTPCTTATEYSDKLTLPTGALETDGHDGMPFKGIFTHQNATNRDIFADTGTVGVKKAQLLPGLQSTFNQLNFYVYDSTAAQNMADMKTFPCINPPPGANIISVMNPTDTTTFDIDFRPIANLFSSGNFGMGICAINNGTPFPMGFWKSNSESGSGSNSPYYMRLEGLSSLYTSPEDATTHISNYNFRVGKCYSVTPSIYYYNGTTASAFTLPGGSGTLSLNPSSLLSAGIFYKDSTCSTAVATGDGSLYQIAAGGSTMTSLLWMKSSSAQNNVATSITSTDGTGLNIGMHMNLYQRYNFLKQMINVEMVSGGPYIVGSCLQMRARIINEFNAQTNENAATNYNNLTIVEATNQAVIYNSGTCSPTGASAIPIPFTAATSEVNFWVKPLTSGLYLNFSVVPNGDANMVQPNMSYGFTPP